MIKIFFPLILFSIYSFNVNAEEISLERYYDEIGNGILSEGILTEDKVISESIIEKENCVPRAAQREDRFNFEFDFLGFAEPIPDKINMDHPEILEQNAMTIVLKSTPDMKKGTTVCHAGEEAFYTSARLVMHKNDISIIWIQSCKANSVTTMRFRKLQCDLEEAKQ